MPSVQEFDFSQYAPSEGNTGVTRAVWWLIALNVGVYFLQVVVFGTATVTTWLALAVDQFPGQWWTVATYMFVHAGLVHLATNMAMLWMFGPRVERAFGTRSFTYFYLWCGVGGAIFHLLFVRSGGVVGASGAVVGVVLAYALRWPDDEVYLFGAFPMRARWLAIWTIAINVGMALADMTGYAGSTTAWMTHVGGLAFAWLYLHAPTAVSLDRIRRHVAAVPDTPEPHPIPKTLLRGHRQRPHDQAAHGGQPDALPATDEVIAGSAAAQSSPHPAPHPVSVAAALRAEQRVDDINALLDKISREGMESLTPIERQLLEDVSRRLRES